MTNNFDHYAAERQQSLITGKNLAHRFVEKPAMKRLLTDLTGKRILLIGCGTGEETLILEEFGANDIHGIDMSETSIQLAATAYPSHQFSVGDMHQVDFADATFDLVYSSLAVHYSPKPLDVYKEVFRVLKPGGIFQFSTGHPMRWASASVIIDGKPAKVLGFGLDREGRSTHLYGDYSTFARHEASLPNGQTEQVWISSPSGHFSLLQQAGFMITDFIETQPVEELRTIDESYYNRCNRFPQFTVFAAKKPKV